MDRPQAWDDYEQAIMDGKGDDVDAPDDDYVMSQRFKDWLVEQMRKEVMGQALGAVMDIQPKMRDKA